MSQQDEEESWSAAYRNLNTSQRPGSREWWRELRAKKEELDKEVRSVCLHCYGFGCPKCSGEEEFHED